MKYRRLGKTGIEVSALGFGGLRFPKKNEKEVDVAEAIKMMRTAVDKGINYIDTGYIYHDGESEKIIGKALKDGYREKVHIATKSPVWMLESADDFDRILDEQLERLDVDCIDFYLFHALSGDNWENKVKKLGLMDRMKKAKSDGKIAHIGFSFHDRYESFVKILDEFEGCEVCQIQMNYVDINNQATMKGLMEAANRGLGVIIMEPVRGGRLAPPPPGVAKVMTGDKPYARHALDFLWDIEEVSLVLSGMSNMEQTTQNLEWAEAAYPGMLTDEQREMYAEAERVWKTSANVPCTKCEYCLPCPAGIEIPTLYEAFNYSAIKAAKKVVENYGYISEKAAECIACGKCTEICPQQIDGVAEMKKIADLKILPEK
ncbi:MAG: aldo/keto reductase [Clostridia bacterium]|nr:aldo/keto reductase [Clostridia bacterium]